MLCLIIIKRMLKKINVFSSFQLQSTRVLLFGDSPPCGGWGCRLFPPYASVIVSMWVPVSP